eukprot:11194845-Alexandrium_andersonii.AAC.1
MLCLKLKWPRLSAINQFYDSEADDVLGVLGLLVGGLLGGDVVVADKVERALGRSGTAHPSVAE